MTDPVSDAPTATIGLGPTRPAPDGLPDPDITPPTIAEAGDPFTTVRVIDLLARLERGTPDPTRRHRRSPRRDLPRLAVQRPGRRRRRAPAPGELDGRLPQRLRHRHRRRPARRRPSTIEDSSRVDPWIVRQAQRAAAAVYRAAGRFQPPRPTDVGRLSREPRPHHRATSHQITRREPHDRQRIRHRETRSSTATGRWRTSNDPNVRFVEVDVDTTAYEQSHIPGAVGLELDEPAGRRDPPRHRRPRGLRRAAVASSGIGPGHDDRPVRRQQQLVRRVGLLAAQAVRPRGRPDPQRRAQVLARQRAGAERRRAVVRGDRLPAARAGLQPARLPRRHPAAARRSGVSRWSTSARRPSSTARSSRPRA